MDSMNYDWSGQLSPLGDTMAEDHLPPRKAILATILMTGLVIGVVLTRLGWRADPGDIRVLCAGHHGLA